MQDEDPLLIERSLLGCVIRDRDVMDLLPPLAPDDFMDAIHADLWKCIRKEAELGQLRSWDADVLARKSGIDRTVLVNLQLSAPRKKGIASEYAKLIKESSFNRRVRSRLETILRSEASGEVLRSLVEREMSGVLDSDLADSGPKLLGASLSDWFDRKQQMITSGADMYITTGFPDIDERTGGLRPGELMIVAGRPATGKTQFSLAIAEHNAAQGKKVHYQSLEMMDDQMLNRMISRQGVHANKLRNLHKQDDPDAVLGEAMDAARRISTLPIFVDYTSDDLATISAHARRMKRRENTSVLIVDYLQLVGDESAGGRNRTEEVARISRGLKRLAINLKIPIVALAQLNRELERDGNRRPQLSDLREAGSIEQDADFVVFLWRHGLSFPKEGEPANDATNVVEIITAKGREVQPGSDYLRAEFQYARFKSLSAQERDNYRNLIRTQTPGSMAKSGGSFM